MDSFKNKIKEFNDQYWDKKQPITKDEENYALVIIVALSVLYSFFIVFYTAELLNTTVLLFLMIIIFGVAMLHLINRTFHAFSVLQNVDSYVKQERNIQEEFLLRNAVKNCSTNQEYSILEDEIFKVTYQFKDDTNTKQIEIVSKNQLAILELRKKYKLSIDYKYDYSNKDKIYHFIKKFDEVKNNITEDYSFEEFIPNTQSELIEVLNVTKVEPQKIKKSIWLGEISQIKEHSKEKMTELLLDEVKKYHREVLDLHKIKEMLDQIQDINEFEDYINQNNNLNESLNLEDYKNIFELKKSLIDDLQKYKDKKYQFESLNKEMDKLGVSQYYV